PHLFDEAAIFAQYRLATADSLDYRYMAIRLFQQLIRLHLADARPDALIAVDIERLEFVHANNFLGRLDDVYKQAFGKQKTAYEMHITWRVPEHGMDRAKERRKAAPHPDALREVDGIGLVKGGPRDDRPGPRMRLHQHAAQIDTEVDML